MKYHITDCDNRLVVGAVLISQILLAVLSVFNNYIQCSAEVGIQNRY